MAKLARRRILAFEIESGGYGVDPTPDGADAILIEELNWSLVGRDMVPRPAIRSSLGTLQHIYPGMLLEATFLVEVKGSGAAGTPPEIGKLLRACAHSETISAGTSVAYAPISSTQESGTAYIWEDGTLMILTGCRGTVDFTGAVGERLMASFTIRGHFSGPTDVSLPTPTYDSTVPPILINGSFAVGGYGAIIQALNFTPGLTLETPPNLNAADGFSEVLVTGRDVNGSINPEQVLVATHNFMAAFKAGTTVALDTGVIGATAGNRFQIEMPAVYYRGLAPGIREGVQIYELPFGAAEDSGDDEYTITFT